MAKNDKAAIKALKDARADLAEASKGGEETEATSVANAAVIKAEANVAWWRRMP